MTNLTNTDVRLLIEGIIRGAAVQHASPILRLGHVDIYFITVTNNPQNREILRVVRSGESFNVRDDEIHLIRQYLDFQNLEEQFTEECERMKLLYG